MSHWGSFDWEGRGGCKGHRRGACKEEGVEEEAGPSEGKNDEELDIAITNCWATETVKEMPIKMLYKNSLLIIYSVLTYVFLFFFDIAVEWLLIGSYVYFPSTQQCLTLSVLVHPFVNISASYCSSPVSCGCFWHRAFSFIYSITIVKNFDLSVAWNL